MSQLAYKLIPGDPLPALRLGASSPALSAHDVRAIFERRRREAAVALENLELDIAMIVDNLIDALRKQPVDCDPVVDRLDEMERAVEKDAAAVRRSAQQTMKQAARNQPELLAALNEGLREYGQFAEQQRKLYHDARWRLIEARAASQKGVPDGRIHGTPSDTDALSGSASR